MEATEQKIKSDICVLVMSQPVIRNPVFKMLQDGAWPPIIGDFLGKLSVDKSNLKSPGLKCIKRG